MALLNNTPVLLLNYVVNRVFLCERGLRLSLVNENYNIFHCFEVESVKFPMAFIVLVQVNFKCRVTFTSWLLALLEAREAPMKRWPHLAQTLLYQT